MKKEDFEQWKELSTTKEIMSYIDEARKQHVEVIISYAKSGDEINAARIAGNIEAFDYLLNIEFEGEA